MKSLRLFLLPFSLVYWVVVAVRNWFFDIGILQTTNLGKPVISVGNLSVGGVGKTPIVEMLIEKLAPHLRLAVVSRGYGRKSSGLVVVSDGRGLFAPVEISGDEPVQLAGKHPGLIVVADEKRVRGARKAEELGAEAILLDDGFQHRYQHRDLNIVVLTAQEIIEGDWLLPAGNRREPMKSLKRSDLMIVSRCADVQDFHRAKSKLERFSKPIVGMQTELRRVKDAFPGREWDLKEVAGKKAVAFSGIGNPKSFEDVLVHAGIKLEYHFVFSDHHWYSEDDIAAARNKRYERNADLLITTEKDAARMNERFGNFLKSEKVLIAEICQKSISGEELLDEALKKAVS